MFTAKGKREFAPREQIFPLIVVFEVLFPPFKDSLQLATEMGDFFVKKICDIHLKLDKIGGVDLYLRLCFPCKSL